VVKMPLGLKGNVTMSDYSASLTSLCQSFKPASPKPIRIKNCCLLPCRIIAWRFGVIVVSRTNKDATKAS